MIWPRPAGLTFGPQTALAGSGLMFFSFADRCASTAWPPRMSSLRLTPEQISDLDRDGTPGRPCAPVLGGDQGARPWCQLRPPRDIDARWVAAGRSGVG